MFASNLWDKLFAVEYEENENYFITNGSSMQLVCRLSVLLICEYFIAFIIYEKFFMCAFVRVSAN